MSEHRWGPKFRCINGSCAIIQHASRQGWWRRGWGRSKWRNDPLPPCVGARAQSPSAHVERPSCTRCERPALPRLLVCEQHATPDALRMVILAMDAEIQNLKQLSDTSLDNPSEPTE